MNETSNAKIIRCVKCGANNRVTPEEKTPEREAVCGRCKTPLVDETHPLTVTDANYSNEVERSPLPVLLDFWADWCGPCHMIAPVIEQLAAELAGRVRVAKLNIDDNPMTASRFNVRSIPTLLILKEGREVERIVGAQPKQAIMQRLQTFI